MNECTISSDAEIAENLDQESTEVNDDLDEVELNRARIWRQPGLKANDLNSVEASTQV